MSVSVCLRAHRCISAFLCSRQRKRPCANHVLGRRQRRPTPPRAARPAHASPAEPSAPPSPLPASPALSEAGGAGIAGPSPVPKIAARFSRQSAASGPRNQSCRASLTTDVARSRRNAETLSWNNGKGSKSAVPPARLAFASASSASGRNRSEHGRAASAASC